MITGKRGDISSLIIIVVVLFTISLIVLLFTVGFHSALDKLKATPQFSNNSMALKAVNTGESATKYLDYFFLMAFIGLSLGLIISSIFIRVHPAFFIVLFFGWIFLIVVSAILSNVFVQIVGSGNLSQTASQLPFIDNLMPLLPYLFFVIGLIMMVILLGKPKNVTEI